MKKEKPSVIKSISVVKEFLTTAMDDKIIIYTDDNGDIELRADVKGETIWAAQTQIADLFDVNIRTINEHLMNIYNSKELKQNSVIRKFRITAKDSYNIDRINQKSGKIEGQDHH